MAKCLCVSDRPYKIRPQMFGFFMPVTCTYRYGGKVGSQGGCSGKGWNGRERGELQRETVCGAVGLVV